MVATHPSLSRQLPRGSDPRASCARVRNGHAGTTDIDVQVDLEIVAGAVNTKRLETALQNAEFVPDDERIWRWRADGSATGAVVKFELLADVDTERSGSTIEFDQCEHLGAANLRGTGVAARDIERRPLRARVGDQWIGVEINVTGLAGFLLAKAAAAHSRRKTKDWTTSPSCCSKTAPAGLTPQSKPSAPSPVETSEVTRRRSTTFAATSPSRTLKTRRRTPNRCCTIIRNSPPPHSAPTLCWQCVSSSTI